MSNLYPEHPGAKGQAFANFATSVDAAAAIAPTAQFLQTIDLRALAALGEATALECVAITDVPRESLQLRYSELMRLGLIEPTGERRRNRSGKDAAVLRLTEMARARLKGGDT